MRRLVGAASVVDNNEKVNVVRRFLGGLAATGVAAFRYMPEHFYARAYGVRSMLDTGLTVALSTDAPVVADDNPLLGLKSAIDRRDHVGEPLGPNQAIMAAEALWAYTQAGAILGKPNREGSSATVKSRTCRTKQARPPRVDNIFPGRRSSWAKDRYGL